MGIWKFTGQGSNQSYSCQPTTQPQQCQILNPLSKTRDQNHILMDPSQVCYSRFVTPIVPRGSLLKPRSCHYPALEDFNGLLLPSRIKFNFLLVTFKIWVQRSSRHGSVVHESDQYPWGWRLHLWVQSLASLSGLRIQCCRELWCRFQRQLGSCVAVVVT